MLMKTGRLRALLQITIIHTLTVPQTPTTTNITIMVTVITIDDEGVNMVTIVMVTVIIIMNADLMVTVAQNVIDQSLTCHQHLSILVMTHVTIAKSKTSFISNNVVHLVQNLLSISLRIFTVHPDDHRRVAQTPSTVTTPTQHHYMDRRAL